MSYNKSYILEEQKARLPSLRRKYDIRLKQLETAQEVFNEAKAKLEYNTLAIEKKKQACKEDLVKIINDTTLYLIDLELNTTDQALLPLGFTVDECRDPDFNGTKNRKEDLVKIINDATLNLINLELNTTNTALLPLGFTVDEGRDPDFDGTTNPVSQDNPVAPPMTILTKKRSS